MNAMKLPRKLKKKLKGIQLRKNGIVGIWRTKDLKITGFEKYRYYYKPNIASLGDKAVTSFSLGLNLSNRPT